MALCNTTGVEVEPYFWLECPSGWEVRSCKGNSQWKLEYQYNLCITMGGTKIAATICTGEYSKVAECDISWQSFMTWCDSCLCHGIPSWDQGDEHPGQQKRTWKPVLHSIGDSFFLTLQNVGNPPFPRVLYETLRAKIWLRDKRDCIIVRFSDPTHQ